LENKINFIKIKVKKEKKNIIRIIVPMHISDKQHGTARTSWSQWNVFNKNNIFQSHFTFVQIVAVVVVHQIAYFDCHQMPNIAAVRVVAVVGQPDLVR
jgi:hypothetical protein